MRVTTWLLAATATTATAFGLVACIKSTAFNCGSDDSSCGGGGMCEPQGFCSIAVSTSECPSGRQFSDTAGDGLAGQCVGGGPGPDGPVTDGPGDGPVTDGPTDSGGGCDASFTTVVAGGNPNHKYKFIVVSDDWLAQQNTVCVGQSSYLAIPDDAAELAGLFAAAGDNPIWVGVNDRVDEGVYKEVLTNTVYTAIAINEGNGNQMGQNCIASGNGTTLDTENCDETRVAVCECDE